MALLTLKSVSDLRNPDAGIIEFHGELDKSTLHETESEIRTYLEKFQGRALIFDLSDLKYANSEAIGYLVSMHVKLTKLGKHLALCGMQPQVLDVFEAIGLSKIIPTFVALADAVTYTSKS